MKKSFYVVNFITLIRVIGALLLFPIYFNYGVIGLLIASIIFLSTDCIDGFIARNFKCSTFFGAIFDAASDKLFNIVILIIIALNIPIMYVVLALEVAILLVEIHSAFKGNLTKSTLLGKVKMVVMSLGFIILIAMIGYHDLAALFNLGEINTNLITDIVSSIVIMFVAITLLDYLSLDIKHTMYNKYVKKTVFTSNLKDKKELKNMLFSTEFYEENKNKAIEDLVIKNTK